MSGIQTLATLVLGGAFDATELGENDFQPDMKLIEELQQRLVTVTDDVYVELINRAELDRVTAENAALQQRLNAADQRIDELTSPPLTDELRWILGQMCFQHIHTAQALRLMGHEIAKKAEDEQAVTIHWMLGHYLKDPQNWRRNASAELKAAAPAA